MTDFADVEVLPGAAYATLVKVRAAKALAARRDALASLGDEVFIWVSFRREICLAQTN